MPTPKRHTCLVGSGVTCVWDAVGCNQAQLPSEAVSQTAGGFGSTVRQQIPVTISNVEVLNAGSS